ncbi:MAG: hypothetical protein ACM3JC_02780 [Rudaea sp.]
MLNYADRINRRLDRMPMSRANREMAKAEFAAAEANAERLARALAWAAHLVASMNASMAIERQRHAH